MKYILLVHHNEDVLEQLGAGQLQQMRDESVRLANQINSTGHYLDAAPLQPASTATCVRVREGKQLVTDGPFAETREQLGGYFLINAENLDEAIRIGGQIPGARIGTVEIRPVVELAGFRKGSGALECASSLRPSASLRLRIRRIEPQRDAEKRQTRKRH